MALGFYGSDSELVELKGKKKNTNEIRNLCDKTTFVRTAIVRNLGVHWGSVTKASLFVS